MHIHTHVRPHLAVPSMDTVRIGARHMYARTLHTMGVCTVQYRECVCVCVCAGAAAAAALADKQAPGASNALSGPVSPAMRRSQSGDTHTHMHTHTRTHKLLCVAIRI